jgi:hypothetical protein
MGIIKDPTQYFQVLETGRLDVLFEGDISQQLLVRQENELLSEGQNPITAPTDLHAFHIQEHRSVLDDTDVRMNPQITKVVMDHIQGHLDMLTNTDPRLLMLTGQQPIPPAGMPLPGAPSGDQGAGGPPPGPGGPPPAKGGGNSNQSPNDGAPNMPQMPEVPAEALANPALQEQAMNNVKQR